MLNPRKAITVSTRSKEKKEDNLRETWTYTHAIDREGKTNPHLSSSD